MTTGTRDGKLNRYLDPDITTPFLKDSVRSHDEEHPSQQPTIYIHSITHIKFSHLPAGVESISEAKRDVVQIRQGSYQALAEINDTTVLGRINPFLSNIMLGSSLSLPKDLVDHKSYRCNHTYLLM